MGWTVTPGPVAPTYAYKWTIRRNNAVVLKEGKLDLSSGQDKIEIEGDQPEMIYVAIEPYAALAVAVPAPGAATSSATPGGLAALNAGSPAPDAASTAAAQAGANQAGASSASHPASVAAPAWTGVNTGSNNGLYAVGAAVAPTPLSTTSSPSAPKPSSPSPRRNAPS